MIMKDRELSVTKVHKIFNEVDKCYYTRVKTKYLFNIPSLGSGLNYALFGVHVINEDTDEFIRQHKKSMSEMADDYIKNKRYMS